MTAATAATARVLRRRSFTGPPLAYGASGPIVKRVTSCSHKRQWRAFTGAPSTNADSSAPQREGAVSYGLCLERRVLQRREDGGELRNGVSGLQPSQRHARPVLAGGP